ncbi:MAG: glycosyltransferase [Ignavibacteriae bacterium]|nr:glycosyltransferase [Ignavibacteriota bacterium]
MIRVQVASYQAVSILHGGPSTQLEKTIRCMDQFGVDARKFDSWAPFNRATCDLFHLFAANIGTYHLAREIHTLGIPLVVSPIIYSLHSHRYVRAMLTTTRLLKKVGKGLWSDYGMTAEMCSWAKAVLPNSRAEADLVIHGLGVDAAKVTVIPNGVEERFANADPALFKQKYGVENFILNVGHIGHGRKNVLALIKALGAIDHPAVIIGRIIDGEYGAACVREAAKHKHVLLIDGLQHDSEMLASAYAAADVFALPSLFETPGIAALEAGLAGAKIVITPHGGTREYFGEMAVYVDPHSVDSIREGIQKVLELRKDNALREHIRREYLWQRISEKTAAAYRKILSTP